jgi:sulfur carrier protein
MTSRIRGSLKSSSTYPDFVLVHLHNPKREIEVPGPLHVNDLVSRLGLNREAVLVIRGDSLVTGDARLDDGDDIEIRPVISGGSV